MAYRALEDREVATAVRFIRENAGQSISVDDAVKATMLSRSALYQRFHKTLGRSLTAEIRRVRIDSIKRLLRDTGLTASEIAHKLDFVDVGNLWRYFRKSTGTTPLQYRRRHRHGGGQDSI
ncbi:MAG: helix-turn-helix domain-containing protein [Planctomycetota bacterium]